MAKQGLHYRDSAGVLYRTILTAFDLETGIKKVVLKREDETCVIMDHDKLFHSRLVNGQVTYDFIPDEEANKMWEEHRVPRGEYYDFSSSLKAPAQDTYPGDLPGDSRAQRIVTKGSEVRATYSNPNRSRR